MPGYAHEGDAGMDVYSAIECVIKPGERKLVPTGIKMAIPRGYEVQVRPKSGLALKHGLSIVNTPGTIDAGYRGEVGVILINHSNDEYKVEKNMKVAQLVVNKIEEANVVEVKDLDDTSRGEGGFGSTGLE